MRPLLHYDASTEASRTFNSCPTSPRIDFGRGYLLSLCIYCLLETQRLLVTPRQYGDGLSVLTQSGITSFHIETLDLCDLVSH
jgi:hypothetical protein